MDDITQNIRILNSKLLIPRFSDTIIRKRLHPLFSEIAGKKVTAVIAGAGYGKTTLIAQACKILDLNTVWYRIDGSDKDFITFIHYLIAGIRNHYKDIGKETFQRIKTAQILSREHKAVLTVLLSELEKYVKKNLVIVMDDYHLIHDSMEINKTLSFLIEQLPQFIHLVIISRFDPDINLSLYRARREVLDIREDDLAFTISEVQQLYLQLFNITIQKKNLEALHKKTDGWVSGLILFYHSFKGKSPAEIEELLLKLKGSHKIIFNYLEENVYDLLPYEIMNFLTKASILSRLNIDFCNRFLEIDDSRDILMHLEEKHLFTWPFDEDRQWYYFHHLFQDFLQKKLYQELGREVTQKLHLKAAMLWEKVGEDEEAMSHYLKARQIEKACELLSAMGRRKLLKENRLQLINSYLKEIPDSYSEANPWIQFTRARVMEFSGKPQQAIEAYTKSYKIFRKDGFTKGIGKCLKGLASNYFMIGDFQRAEEMLGEVLKQVEAIPRFRLDILGYMIFIASHLGKMRKADKYYEEAVALPESNERIFHVWLMFNKGFRYGVSGDFILSLKTGEEILSMSGGLGLHQLHIMTFHLIAWSCYYLGLFPKGKEYAEKGLQLVEEIGIYDGAQAWLLMSLALNATALDMIPEAILNGKKSLKIFKELEIRWGQAYANHTLQYAYQKSGDLQEAEECARSALDIVKGLDLPLDEGYIKCGLADLFLEQGKTAEAAPLLKDAEKKLKNSKMNLCRVKLQYARFYWEEKQCEAAIDKLHEGLLLSEANHYDTWVLNEKHWIIPLLVEMFSRGKMEDYINHIFKKSGIYTTRILKKLQKGGTTRVRKAISTIFDELSKMPSPGLRVYCFGKFQLFRGEEELSAENWSSEKAKLLFKYFVFEKSRGYQHKDILMELLWPEEDPAVTGNRLRVALTTIRKTLEPELARGKNSSYLYREGDSYILNFGDSGWSDIEEFNKELKLAKDEKNSGNAISHYLKAASLYQGDLFEEDRFLQWCIDVREEYKEKYLDILMSIINFYDQKRDYPKSIEYARRYLNVDKYAEDIYQLLMQFYSRIGNRAMIIKTFEQCKEHFERGMDSLPDKETTSLYRQLLSS